MVVNGLEPKEVPVLKNEEGQRTPLPDCGSCHGPKWLTHVRAPSGDLFPKVVHDMEYHKRIGGAKRSFQKMITKGGKV